MAAEPGGSLTDRSGTITLGGTSQTAAGVNTGRQYLIVQNIDPAEDLWVNLGSAAAINTAGSFQIKAGGSIVWEMGGGIVPTSTVTVNATTTGHKFTCKEA